MTFLRYLFAAVLLAVPGFAHAFNQSYVYLRLYEDRVEGRVEINLFDLNRALGLEFATDHSVKPEDVEAHLEKIRSYVFGRVAFKIGGEVIELELAKPQVLDDEGKPFVSNGNQYLRCGFTFQGVTERPSAIEITHNLLYDVDPEHRGFVVIEHYFKQGMIENEGQWALAFTPDATTKTLEIGDGSVWQGVKSLAKLGVDHILGGIDHILFLLALLLPAVLRRNGKGWEPRENFGSSLWQVLKIVTVFTVAHSITLSIGALGYFSPPPHIVEGIIAVSIAVAAIDILFPIFKQRILLVVLIFGLFHGFGFAGFLGEMGITGSNKAWSLLGFNVGVEIGQIAIVLAVFPFLFMMRLSKLYFRFAIYAAALLSIFVALYWGYERFTGEDLQLGAFLNKHLGVVMQFV